ncbi:helix-turn-helix transcriptional regulator [Eggerthella sp. YY7918]|nr:helix-turn-helix transcriptional regulator [Eggerthella sp. YY7918]
MVGVSRQYLIDIESGRANPTVDVLERIAGGLDIPIRALFEDF